MTWLALFVFNLFFIQGIYYCTYYEQGANGQLVVKRPFSRIAYRLRNLPDWIKSPLYACTRCMPTVWGTLIFFAFALYSHHDINSVLFIKFVGYNIALTGYAAATH